MTQDEAKQAQQLTEQVVLTRIAKKDAELTAMAAQRQYDNFLSAVVSKTQAADGSASAGGTQMGLTSKEYPTPSANPGPVPTWLSSKSGS
jgi:hypothetical protein